MAAAWVGYGDVRLVLGMVDGRRGGGGRLKSATEEVTGCRLGLASVGN